jgi:hypothetical protein
MTEIEQKEAVLETYKTGYFTVSPEIVKALTEEITELKKEEEIPRPPVVKRPRRSAYLDVCAG